MVNPYFGEPWDAPAVDAAPRVATPVGVPCLWCGVPVERGDRGFMVGCARLGEDGEPYGSVEPYHRECQMRSVIGSPAHLDGECFCHTGEPDQHPSTPQEKRAEAIEVWDRVLRGEIGRGARVRPEALDVAASNDSRIVNHG